jgi:hypothetical protein
VEQVARQLLRAIRGSRSQVAFSRRLGYRGNPAADWEAGRSFPTAAGTLRACDLAGIDVPGAFARFHPESAFALADADDDGVRRWLKQHQGQLTVVELAERVERSRFSVARWLSGESRPRLPDFLRIIEAMTGRLSSWVAELVPIGAVPILAAHYRAGVAASRLAFDEPWTAAVLRVLETQAYRDLPRHVPGYFAEALEIPLSTERRCLEQLERLGVIDLVDGRYIMGRPLSVSTHAEPAELRALGAHWTEVSLARQRAPRRQGDLFSYNLFSVSEADMHRIREAHVRYYREVRAIVASSEPCERVALINVHLMVWPGPASAD